MKCDNEKKFDVFDGYKIVYMRSMYAILTKFISINCLILVKIKLFVESKCSVKKIRLVILSHNVIE